MGLHFPQGGAWAALVRFLSLISWLPVVYKCTFTVSNDFAHAISRRQLELA